MKNSFKRILKRSLISFFLACLAAVAIVVFFEMLAGGFVRNKNDIYDFKKFSIESLSDEEIVENPDCYKAFMQREPYSYYLTGYETPAMSDYAYTAKRITGVITVHITDESILNLYKKDLTTRVQAKLKAGKATMVVIRDGEIIDRVNLEKNSEFSEFSYQLEKNSNYVIKLVCKSAKIEIESIRR